MSKRAKEEQDKIIDKFTKGIFNLTCAIDLSISGIINFFLGKPALGIVCFLLIFAITQRSE